jgi:uncharacterized protein YkwD
MLGLFAGCQDDQAFSVGPWKMDGQSKSTTTSRAACEDPPDASDLVQEILGAVNAQRAHAGVPLLRLDPTLTKVADFYACRLAEDGFFAHEDPFDGSTIDVRAANFGYPFLKIGENLAAGQWSVDQVMDDWMASPEHRANILDPAYTDIGIVVKLGGDCGTYWVQEFGRPLTPGSISNPTPANQADESATEK